MVDIIKYISHNTPSLTFSSEHEFYFQIQIYRKSKLGFLFHSFKTFYYLHRKVKLFPILKISCSQVISFNRISYILFIFGILIFLVGFKTRYFTETHRIYICIYTIYGLYIIYICRNIFIAIQNIVFYLVVKLFNLNP